ncbi:MAG: ABC transporter permease subunit [Ignavibacteriales bacterium]|nr:ABC transporter permease subunit [Ignavibacteriales bacterium]
MNRKKYFLIKNYSPLIISLILWIILFEFIIPTNYFVPKPSVVLESFASLWNDYNILPNLFSTFGCIYLSLLIALISQNFLSNKVVHKKFSKYLIKKRNKSRLFFLIFSFLILSAIWFSDFYFLKIIFASVISTFTLTIKNIRGMDRVHPNFIDSMKSLGFPNDVIQNKIISKLVRPSLLNYLKNYQFVLWTIITIYEVFIDREGIGFMLKKIVEYRDLSAAIALLAILGFILLLVNRIHIAITKNFNYENDHE